ncbi:MAG: glycosyltransferase [Candidatus Delongbacteria bacterium]|nr:glycosyltransferase [Candidatus Delongbacteria bacterium]MBN2833919.1 glycosyltransferase [Candidatus Delongbacteria bacterium]
MKYILTGGGSGGHVYPALAIAEKIKKENPNSEFLYVGCKNKIESTIVPGKGYKFQGVNAIGMPPNKKSIKFLYFITILFWGILKSSFIVYKYKPDMIIATGGFASAPVVFGTVVLRKIFRFKTKIFLFEANAEPGKMIEATGKYADGVGTVYKDCVRFFPGKAEYVGYPVREIFFKQERDIRKELNLPENKFIVLVFGGSQGSKAINDGIHRLLDQIENENIYIVHATGKDSNNYKAYSETKDFLSTGKLKKSYLKNHYEFHPYLEEIDKYYKACDLVIARAGAGTITEIAVTGKPSILIPLSNLAGDHQVVNAMYMKNIGAAEILFEEYNYESKRRVVCSEKLFRMILDLKQNKSKRNYLVVNSAHAVENVGTDYIYRFIKSIEDDTLNKIKTWSMTETFDEELSEIKPETHFSIPFAGKSASRIFEMIKQFSNDPKSNVLSEHTLSYLYLQYKADSYISSENWEVRNNGVKLIGLIKDRSRIELLSKMFNNREPVSFVKRKLGGDYREVGFIRRNIMTNYRKLSFLSETVYDDLKTGLSDNYFEVVTETLKTIIYFRDELKNDSSLKELVRNTLESNNFEILMEAISCYGIFINSIEEYALLRRFNYHPNWKVREALLQVLIKLYRSSSISKEQLYNELKDILITSSGFVPTFSLKNILKGI